MGTLTLNWDNTAVNASANATGQRALKRIAAVGGAFNTSDFSPANTLLKTATTTVATVLNNRVYDFKVEALCTEGGPTENTNGLKQGIVFACIPPIINIGPTNIEVTIDLTSTDITKARIVLKLASDDSIISTQVVSRSVNTVYYNFSGLASDGYYLEIELYATVDGVEVISSDETYLGVVCGGNVEGYQADISSGSILVNNASTSGIIANIEPAWFFTTEGSIPTLPGNTADGGHGGYTGNFGVQITGGFGTALKLFVNGIEVDCLNISADGIYTFVGVSIGASDDVEIRLINGSC
jgi:hypothetical protein